jgi:hypothetical protein
MKHIGLSPVISRSLGRIFDLAGGDVVGVSLYTRLRDGIAAPSHCVTDPSAPFVRDHLTERFIPPTESIAAKLLAGQTFTVGDGVVSMSSIPFADAHVCHHFFDGSGQTAVQVVKNKGAGDTITSSTMRLVADAAQTVFGQLDDLRVTFEDNLARAFNVKSNAETKAIVLYADITGYSKICETYGIEKAGALIEKLKANFVSPACRDPKYNVDIFRPSNGDDLWIAFPLEDGDDLAQALENRVLPFTREMLAHYDLLIGGDPYYKNHPLKVSLAHGPIEESLSGPFLRRHITLIGDVLRRAAYLNNQADRTRNSIVIDSDLKGLVSAKQADVVANGSINHLVLKP